MAKRKKQKKGWYSKEIGRLRKDAVAATEEWIEYQGGDRALSDPGEGNIQEVSRAVVGPPPPLQELAAHMQIEGLPVRTERDVRLYANRMMRSVHRSVRWANFGMPVYILDPDTAGMLALTDADRLKQEEVRFPFPTFFIVLEPGAPLYFEGREVRWITVHHFQAMVARTPKRGEAHPEEGREGRVLEFTLQTSDTQMQYTLVYRPGRTVGDWLKALAGGPSPGPSEQAASSALHLIVSLAMYLRLERPARSKPRHPVAKKGDELGLPKPADWYPAKATMPTEIKAALKERGAITERKISARHVVRGHWRMQAHGPARSLRTAKWIEPHWRGVGPAAVTRTARAPRKKNPAERRAALRRLMRL